MIKECSNINDIPWKKWWEERMENSSWSKKSVKVWDKRAPYFYQNSKEKQSAYIKQLLGKLSLKRDMSLLDMGCGPGTLTIPLAKKVKKVTALDISEEMLKYVRKEAKDNSLTNIDYIHRSWEETEIGKHILPHDIVIASRSFPEKDPLQSIKKLDQIARKAVYITMWVNHDENENFYRDTYNYIGKKYTAAPDYIFVYNMLYKLGIFAHLEFLEYKDTNIYQNQEEMLNDWLWRIHPESDGQKQLLKKYLQKRFSWKDQLKMELNCKWALIWWEKEA